jgi:murein DD-endopeptidase MepM/ murein hydrolase activator NlpD
MRFEPFDREGFRQFITSDEPLGHSWRIAAGSGFCWMLVITGFVLGLGVGHALDGRSRADALEVAHRDAATVMGGELAATGADPAATIGDAASAAGQHAAAAKAAAVGATLPLAAAPRPSGDPAQVEVPDAHEPEAPAEARIAVEVADGAELRVAVAMAADATAGADADRAESSASAAPEAAPASTGIDRLPVDRRRSQRSATEGLTLVTHGELARGETLGTALADQGISAATVHVIASEMRPVFDFRRSRPGDHYRLAQDADGRVLDFRYRQAPEETFHLVWNDARYVARKESAELHPQIAKIAGVIDSSFYGAILALGEQTALANEFARIFAWDIDFTRNVHPGDEFQILYERLYRRNVDGEEVYVRPGRVLAAHFDGQVGEYTVVYFEDENGVGSYFRPDGSAIERSFLAAPLEFSRISSRFSRARHHPILNITRPHPGIDYAAPLGTPVWAVADGVVEYRARAGASGNLVRIRHAGGYTSHYAHLSRFASGLEVGDRVEQKQVIGYVGSTGLSTGPHVCFRVKKDGRYVDPMRIKSPAGPAVEHDQLMAFEHVRDELLADLGTGPLAVADEAL